MPRVLPLLLLCAAAHAAEVAQFRAEDFGEEWRAARGGAALVAVHPATNGWAAAFADRGGVSFSATNGVASPLEFDPATTSAVARALIVADCTKARPWSALLDAPVGAALAPRAFDWDLVRFATSNCLGAVSVSVDGVAGQDTYRAHYPLPDGHFDVSCRWRDSHSSLLVSDAIRCDPISCRPGQTNFLGAGWTSTHNPTNAADHAPGIVETDVHFGPLCPIAHDVTVKLGWTHDTAILWIRNLVRIVTGDPMDDETDHCIAYDWRKTGCVDLNSFLAPEILPYTNRVEFYVDGRSSSGLLSHGSEPARYHPHVHHVELRSRASGVTFDRLWIVINRRETRINFEKWLSENTNDVSWATRLPKPFASISLSTNANGVISAIDPEPGPPDLWTAPDSTDGSYLHHDAKWEMRAYANEEGHGNQACYDEHGILITNGISGGTADYVPGFWYRVGGHVPKDVYPFLNAVHLDGNPGDSTFMNDVTRPCIRQGTNMDLYIHCRPISLPEEQP